MKDTEKTSLRAVALLLCVFVSLVASAGAISTLETIYVVCGIFNAIITAFGTYKIIKSNTL